MGQNPWTSGPPVRASPEVSRRHDAIVAKLTGIMPMSAPPRGQFLETSPLIAAAEEAVAVEADAVAGQTATASRCRPPYWPATRF